MALKPGFKSSEWWAVVLTAIVAVLPTFLAAFTDAHAGGQGVLASLGVALAAAAYAYGRSKVKAEHERAKGVAAAALGSQTDAELASDLEAG